MSFQNDAEIITKSFEQYLTQAQTADVPVIGMIGSSDLKINAQARMLALGASDVIIKPLDLEQLIQEIQLFYQQTGG